MAASPVSIPAAVNVSSTVSPSRRPLPLSQRRIEANRRNAARSTGPRTPAGKARVARNAIKHGFFAAQERWSPGQQRDFAQTTAGLRDDFKPEGVAEESCIVTIAESYVRMAALLRYENIAALEYHQRRDRELTERIAAASPGEAARMAASREELRRAGLWRPTLPGPREMGAIVRYQGKLDRTIHRALAELAESKKMRLGAQIPESKAQKQTHLLATPRSGPEAAEGPSQAGFPTSETRKQSHFEEPAIERLIDAKNEKTKPLNPMITGNRHERRRAKALAARRR